MNNPVLVNESGKTFLEAVPRLAWGKGKECTFTGSLEAAFSITPTPYAYEDLMGWAGLAFRLRWFLGEGEDDAPYWSASSPVGELAEELAALRRATGYELSAESRSDEAEPHMEEFSGRIAAEIRAGRPVLAHDPTLNMGVIYGFENEGRTVLMRGYMSDEPTLRIPAAQLGGFICFLGSRGPVLEPRTALVEGVRQGVENWHRGYTPGPEGRYWLGHAALLKWRENLEGAGKLCFEDLQLLFFVDWWVFDCLLDARTNAERFLRRQAHLLDGSPRRHLLAAADAYVVEAQMLRGATAAGNVFLGPWTGKELEHWTEAVREREIAFLGRVLTAEAEAIGELENLLDRIGIPTRLAAGAAS